MQNWTLIVLVTIVSASVAIRGEFGNMKKGLRRSQKCAEWVTLIGGHPSRQLLGIPNNEDFAPSLDSIVERVESEYRRLQFPRSDAWTVMKVLAAHPLGLQIFVQSKPVIELGEFVCESATMILHLIDNTRGLNVRTNTTRISSLAKQIYEKFADALLENVRRLFEDDFDTYNVVFVSSNDFQESHNCRAKLMDLKEKQRDEDNRQSTYSLLLGIGTGVASSVFLISIIWIFYCLCGSNSSSYTPPQSSYNTFSF